MKIKALVLAIGSLCAAGGVSAQVLDIVAGGASATRGVITNEVVRNICTTGTITVYQSGSNVTRIDCPTNAAAAGTAATSLVFNYDNTTGSFLGIGPVSGNGTVLRIDPSFAGCSAGAPATFGAKSVTLRTGCNTVNAGRPAIGNADVEPDLFTGVLAPAGGLYNPAGVSSVTGQFGIIFGVATSLPLYRALQTEQGLPLNDLETSAPTLSTSQIVSLSTANGGPLNQNWEALFPNTNPAGEATPVYFVRRVAGSGSHATFSSQFLGTNCVGAKQLVPAGGGDSGGGYQVLEYGATGNQLQAIDSTAVYPTITAAQGSTTALSLNGQAKPANYYAIGYASLENAPGGATANWRFVKVDGQYPSKANVQNGRYNWMAEQVLTLRAGATAAQQGFFARLATVTGSPNAIAALAAPAINGVVALPGIADSSEASYAAQRTRFRTLGNSCVRPFAVE